MAGNTQGARIQELKNSIRQADEPLKNIAAGIESFSMHIQEMMKGDANGPYWNGNQAKYFYFNSIKDINEEISNYGLILDTVDKIAYAVEEMERVNAQAVAAKAGGSKTSVSDATSKAASSTSTVDSNRTKVEPNNKDYSI